MDQDDRTAGLNDVATMMRNIKRQAKQARTFFTSAYNELDSLQTTEATLITSVNGNASNDPVGVYDKALMDELIASRAPLMAELQTIINAFTGLTKF